MMSKWQDKSDFEINRAVANLYLTCDYVLNGESEVVDLIDRKTHLGAHGIPYEVTRKYGEFDPCNVASDAWPIIVNTCMTIELAHPELGQVGTNTIYNPFGTDWQCDYTDNKDCFRAAMIVYLEMNDAQP